MSAARDRFSDVVTLPLSGRQGSSGDVEENYRWPVHSRGLFEVSALSMAYKTIVMMLDSTQHRRASKHRHLGILGIPSPFGPSSTKHWRV